MNVYISDHDPTVKPGAGAPVCRTRTRSIQPWPRWAPATGFSQTLWVGLMVLKWYLLLLVTAVPESVLWCSYRLTSRAEWRWWLWAQIRIALLHRQRPGATMLSLTSASNLCPALLYPPNSVSSREENQGRQEEESMWYSENDLSVSIKLGRGRKEEWR